MRMSRTGRNISRQVSLDRPLLDRPPLAERQPPVPNHQLRQGYSIFISVFKTQLKLQNLLLFSHKSY